jgi:hypothetical protein
MKGAGHFGQPLGDPGQGQKSFYSSMGVLVVTFLLRFVDGKTFLSQLYSVMKQLNGQFTRGNV